MIFVSLFKGRGKLIKLLEVKCETEGTTVQGTVLTIVIIIIIIIILITIIHLHYCRLYSTQ